MRFILSGSWDNSIKVWERTPQNSEIGFDAHKIFENFVGFTQMMILSGNDKSLKVFDIESGKLIKIYNSIPISDCNYCFFLNISPETPLCCNKMLILDPMNLSLAYETIFYQRGAKLLK